MRLKVTANLALGSQYFLFVPGVSGGTSARVTLDFQGNKLRFGARDTDGGSFKSITSNEAIAKRGEYISIAGALDTVNDRIKIHANGLLLKQDTTQTWATISTGNSGTIRLGSAAADNNYSPIHIVDFQFFANTYLSDSDLLTLAQGHAIETAPNVRHRFQGLNGTTLTDDMGNANGTIIGSPTLTTGLVETRRLI